MASAEARDELSVLQEEFARDAGPAAVALVGTDGYLVSEARQRLVAALVEGAGCEVRPFDESDLVGLADDLRTGSLFGGGVVFVLEDPEWLVGAAGDARKRFAALVRAARDGRNPERRLLEFLTARGVAHDPRDPAPMRQELVRLLDENGASGEVRTLLTDLLARAIDLGVEPRRGDDPVSTLLPAVAGMAQGNRLILTLSSPPAKSSPARPLLDAMTVVPVSLPGGDRAQVLLRMASAIAADHGVTIDRDVARELVRRTAGGDGPAAGSGSIRLFRSELDKLAAAAGSGGRITTDLVATLVLDSSQSMAWDIEPEISRRDAVAALAVLGRLLGRSQRDGEAMMLFGYLVNQFRRVLLIHATLGSEVAAAARIGYPGWQDRYLPRLSALLEKGQKDYGLYKSCRMAAAFSPAEAAGAFERLAAIDLAAKSGGPPMADQLEGFLLSTLPRRGRSR